MRPTRTDNALNTLPVGGYVEVFQARSNASKSGASQKLAVSHFASEDPVAVTATAGGATTGLIPATAGFVSITSSVATKAVSLPAALAGKVIKLFCAANGCELISAVAGDKVNTVVVGATNQAALVVGTMYTCRYDGVDNWVMTGLTASGVVETPVTPDGL